MKSVLSLLSLVFFLLLPPMASAENASQDACSIEDPIPCFTLARNYAKGRAPFPKDEARAEELQTRYTTVLREGCLQGDAKLCDQYYGRLTRASDVTEEEKQALALDYKSRLEAGCEANDPMSCAQRMMLWATPPYAPLLSAAMQQTKTMAEVNEDVTHWDTRSKTAAHAQQANLKSECDQGNERACADYHHSRNFFSADQAEKSAAALALLSLCESGSAPACNHITLTLSFPTDDPLGTATKQRLSDACDAGGTNACMSYAGLLSFSEQETLGIPTLKKACALDHAEACGDVATAAYRAYGKSQDPDTLLRATEFFTKACDLGEIISCHYLEHLSKG